MGLKKAIEPHFELALAGDPQHISKMLEVIRPFVIDHLRFRIRCPDRWVEDITQETLVGLWKAIKRGNLKYNGISRYIHQAINNQYIDWCRWRFSKSVTYVDMTEIPRCLVAVVPDFPVDPVSIVTETMTDRQKVVYKLRYEQGKKLKEIAVMTGRSMTATKASLYRIREKFRLEYSL